MGGASGDGEVPGGTSADIYWLIIPTSDDQNRTAQGKLYFAGADLSYNIGGEARQMSVTPDFIHVKPTPKLTLDYFLPQVGDGDDPNTRRIEASTPVPLGVRDRNDGFGTARQFSITSAQPKIVNNQLGLLIGFTIVGSEVNGQAGTNSLKVNFGDIPPSSARTARWLLETTLAGEFKDFKAEFTHADELGGQLTSLIQAVNAHTLVRDVLSDAPGRDSVRDFLASTAGILRLFDSQNVEPEQVADQSSSAFLGAPIQAGGGTRCSLTIPQTAGHAYARIADPFNGQKELRSAVRSDGKSIRSENLWLSRLPDGQGGWIHHIGIFDHNTPGGYELVFADSSATPHAPVLQYISDKTVSPGRQCSFIVEASDEDGDQVAVTAAPLPPGARFFFSRVDGPLHEYVFDWTPGADQIGAHPITFTASDGGLMSSRSMVVTVGSGGFTLTVANGTGSGNYPAGTLVAISANEPPEGGAFDQWTGDVSVVADPLSPDTTLTMPSAGVSVAASYKTVDPNTPLVLHWPFDRNQQNKAYDASGYRFDGALAGDAGWEDAGIMGSGVSFAGSTGQVTSSFKLNLSVWSFSIWAKSPAAPSDGSPTLLLDRGDNCQIFWDNPQPGLRGAVRVVAANQVFTAGFGDIVPGAWCLLTATYDGETLRTYRNGEPVEANESPAGPASGSATPLSLARSAAVAGVFAGSVDDLRVHQTALLPAEVRQLFVDGVGIAVVSESYTVAEDSTLSVSIEQGVLANDSSSQGRVLSASVATPPAHGTLALAPDGSFSYSPNRDFNGSDSFAYAASDGLFASPPVVVVIAVGAVNDAPVAVADSYLTAENTALSVAAPRGVLANDSDPDGNTLTAILVSAPAHGTLTLNADGSLIYQPNQEYSGADEFTYKCSDGSLESAAAIVSIEITPNPTGVLTIAASPAAGGIVDPAPGAHTVDLGAGILASASAAPFWRFTGWTVSGGASVADPGVSPTMASITADGSLTANFARIAVSLSISATPLSGGSTNPEGVVHVDAGEPVMVSAAPSAFWRFISWTVSGGASVTDATQASTTATLTADGTLTARFERIAVALTVTASPAEGGSTTPSGTSQVNAGESLAITAAPSANWKFTGWTVSGGASVADPALASSTVSLSGDGTATAGFERMTAALTMASSPVQGGSTTPVSGSSRVNVGEAVQITASSAAGWSFAGWTAAGQAAIADAMAESTTITLSGDATATAVFSSSSGVVEFERIAVRIDTDDPEDDNVQVKGSLPEDLDSSDLGTPGSFSYHLTVGGWSTVLDQTNGTLSINRRGGRYTYESNDTVRSAQAAAGGPLACHQPGRPQIRLVVNLDADVPFWTLRSRGHSLDPAHAICPDGLVVRLAAGGVEFGGQIPVDATHTWCFLDDGANSSPLPPSGTAISCFDIQKASGKAFDKSADGDSGNFQIQSGELDAPSGFSPSNPAVVQVDAWSVTMTGARPNGKNRYIYTLDAPGQPSCRLLLDFKKGEWDFRAADIAGLLGLVDATDGIDVSLRLGSAQSGVKLRPAWKITLKYPRQDD